MNWFLSLIRSAGASFPVSASLVQLQSEISSAEMEKRLDALTDPISALHDDTRELSGHIYEKIKETDSARMNFQDDFYVKYSRPLAALEANGQIRGSHAAGNSFAVGFRVVDPSYVTYMAYAFEDTDKMEAAYAIVDSCSPGKWLDGKTIKSETGVPIPVVKAIFEIYESKGFGLLSQEVGSCSYMGQA